MKNKKQIIANTIFLVSMIIFVLMMIISLGDIKNIWSTIIASDYRYMLAMLGLIIIYFIVWPMSLVVIMRSECKNIGLWDSYLIGTSEYFFNAITPFSTGGQPFQAYAMKQREVKLSSSTSILMINFIIYQLLINVFAVLALSLYFTTIKDSIPNLIWASLIGFTINFLILFLLLALALSTRVAKLIHSFLAWLSKFKLFRWLERHISSFDQYAVDVHSAFKEIAKKWKVVGVSIILKVIGLAIYYGIPFFALRALHVEIGYEHLFYVMSMSCFAQTMVIWIPTPGAAGGAEFAFTAIFAVLAINQDMAISLMLIWRFFTYYLIMLMGLFGYLAYEGRIKKSLKEKALE